MFEKIHIFISLIAGIIYTFYALTKNWDFFFWLKNVIIVLVLFYILGLIVRSYFRKIFMNKPKESVSVTEEEIEDVAITNEDVEGSKSDTQSPDEENRQRRRFDFNRDDDENDENTES